MEQATKIAYMPKFLCKILPFLGNKYRLLTHGQVYIPFRLYKSA